MKRKSVIYLLVILTTFAAATSLTAQSYKALLPLLVDLPGYKADDAEGMDVSYNDLKAVSVSREYEKKDAELHAGILVGQQSAGVWNPGYQDGFKMESSEGLMEVKEEGGFLMFHSYNKGKKEGMIAVLLAENGADGKGGAVFVFAYRGIGDSDGISLSKKFDWKKMRAEVKSL